MAGVMRVSALYTYPIKSIRPCILQEAELTKNGFRYDRRFMLLQAVHSDGKLEYKNMQVSKYPEMVLFHTSLVWSQDEDGSDGQISVLFKPPNGQEQSIHVPLRPDIEGLETTTVDMYTSSSTAYIMPACYNDWFSGCFGYRALLVYLGPSLRPVLMSTKSPALSASSWLGGLVTWTGLAQQPAVTEHITFADCAPYLVVSERSMDDVDSRLPGTDKMDITKFRPNIIISGADKPWQEDYWAELTFNGVTKLACEHNCARCKSINIDYATGAPGTGEAGKMLAKLQKDRRIDPGMKYSPVFGRYSFLPPDSVGQVVRVGDTVAVTKLNTDTTIFGKSVYAVKHHPNN